MPSWEPRPAAGQWGCVDRWGWVAHSCPQCSLSRYILNSDEKKEASQDPGGSTATPLLERREEIPVL